MASKIVRNARNARGDEIEVVKDSTNSTATVTVACKAPHGLWLRVFEPKIEKEFVIGGGMREVKVFYERGERVRLNGNAHPQNKAPTCQIEGGYALTPGVPKEFWDLWWEQNQTLDAVRNGLIFAMPSADSVMSAARERVDVKSGLERLDPNKLPSRLQPITAKDA